MIPANDANKGISKRYLRILLGKKYAFGAVSFTIVDFSILDFPLVFVTKNHLQGLTAL